MNKPQYELGPLKAAVIQCDINIAAFRRGILQEEEKKDELGEYIRQWEEYNKWLRENGNNIRQG